MPSRAVRAGTQQLAIVTHDRRLRVIGHDDWIGDLTIRHRDRQSRLALIGFLGCIDAERSGDVLPQRVVPVAVRGIEVAAYVASAARVYPLAAVLLEPGIEFSGHRLVRRGPLGVAATEDGVRQVVKCFRSRLVEPLVELDGIVRRQPVIRGANQDRRFCGQLPGIIIEGTQGHLVAPLGSLLRQPSCDALRRPKVRPEQHGQGRIVPRPSGWPRRGLRCGDAASS